MMNVRQLWRSNLKRWALATNRVYIVPTKMGLMFIAVNFVIFMMGLTYANNMALMLAFLLFAFLVVNMITANQNLLQLKDPRIKLEDNFAPEGEVRVSYQTPTIEDYHLSFDGIDCAPA